MQNGLLLRADIHKLFGNYIISVNPDLRIGHEICGIPLTDCFRIITRFSALDRTVCRDIAGNYLDQQLLQEPSRSIDQLLGWHLRQAVFANMRKPGEPMVECAFRAQILLVSSCSAP